MSMPPNARPLLTHHNDPQAPLHAWRDARGVAHLHFNRPQALNAIDLEMAAQFDAATTALAADPGLRLVVLQGAGRAFMAGGDLPQMQQDPVGNSARLIAGIHAGLQRLAALEAPVLAVVQGAVAGGGLGLMLGCDLVLAAEGTQFGVAYPHIGASCDCSTSWGLTRRLGTARAMELMLLAERFDAAEALRLGLVNRVVPTAGLAAAAEDWIGRLAHGPTRAYGRMKALVRAAHQQDLGTQLAQEAESFLAVATSADFREGVAAFLQKRPAVFVGS